MKRVVLTIILFLLLGASVNVAVALGCASFVDLPWIGTQEPDNYVNIESERWIIVWEARGSIRAQEPPIFDFQNYMQRASDTNSREHAEASGFAYWRYVLKSGPNCVLFEARGWPMHALRCALHSDASRPDRWQVDGGMCLSNQQGTATTSLSWLPNPPRVLPLRPLWTGFIINTLFYALILLVLIRGPFIARRMIRNRKGHCVTCGYDLRGNPGGTRGACPECGHGFARGALETQAPPVVRLYDVLR